MSVGLLDAIRSLANARIVVTRYQVGSASAGVWTSGPPATFTAEADDDVITLVDHGFQTGDMLQVVNVGGALPAPLAPDTTYFAIRTGANTFKVAATLGDAHGNNPINLTTDGTGTQSIRLVIDACEQPASGLQRVTGGQDMREEFENQYTTDVLVLWTLTPLRPRDGGDVPTSTDPDVIHFRGRDWTTVRVERWVMPGYGGVPAFKVVFTKQTLGAS